MFRRVLLLMVCGLLFAPCVYGQTLVPTIADFAYGTDSPSQKIDFWQAKSDKPTPVVLMIHGGSWKGGDKSEYNKPANITPLLDAGISVVTVNYRFINEAMEQNVEPPVKACLYDAARALQTVRSKAQEWNIDPERVGATGDSAGACTSLWLAMHDDLADSTSGDAITSQSSRLKCAAVNDAQTSLDPKELHEWMPNYTYGGHAFGFAKFDLFLANREQVLPWIKEYSPIEWASKDDPPIYLDYANQKQPPVVGQNEPGAVHSAIHGIKLAERLAPLGVEVVVSYPGHLDTKYGSISKFLIAKLTNSP